MSSMIAKDATVLFQGDSVTDAGRSRDSDNDLGSGYAGMVAAWFSARYPEQQVRFLNRGISGNRTRDLRARWQRDTLDLHPSWISILIGINDVWRRYDSDDPTSLEAFETTYRQILEMTRLASDARIILMEPFVLPTPPDRAGWREDLDPKIAAVRALAREYNTLFVPLDGLFAAAAAQRPMDFWLPDGVHPSPAGHALIAQAWLRAVRAIGH